MTSNKDALEVFGWGKIGDYYDANLYDAKSYDKGWEDCKKAIRAALASQNPAGTGNKDALEAFEWLLEYHLNPQPYRVKYNDKFCVKRNIVRAALTQPSPWVIDDNGIPKPMHTYNPETHLLIAREDVPSVDNLREAVAHMEQYEITENRMQKWGWYLRYIIDAAALIAQKTEE